MVKLLNLKRETAIFVKFLTTIVQGQVPRFWAVCQRHRRAEVSDDGGVQDLVQCHVHHPDWSAFSEGFYYPPHFELTCKRWRMPPLSLSQKSISPEGGKGINDKILQDNISTCRQTSVCCVRTTYDNLKPFLHICPTVLCLTAYLIVKPRQHRTVPVAVQHLSHYFM